MKFSNHVKIIAHTNLGVTELNARNTKFRRCHPSIIRYYL